MRSAIKSRCNTKKAYLCTGSKLGATLHGSECQIDQSSLPHGHHWMHFLRRQRTSLQGPDRKSRKMVTIESVLSVLWCGDGREDVQVVLGQNCLSLPNRSTLTHVPKTLPGCTPELWPKGDSKEYSSQAKPAHSEDPASPAEELLSRQKRATALRCSCRRLVTGVGSM